MRTAKERNKRRKKTFNQTFKAHYAKNVDKQIQQQEQTPSSHLKFHNYFSRLQLLLKYFDETFFHFVFRILFESIIAFFHPFDVTWVLAFALNASKKLMTTHDRFSFSKNGVHMREQQSTVLFRQCDSGSIIQEFQCISQRIILGCIFSLLPVPTYMNLFLKSFLFLFRLKK